MSYINTSDNPNYFTLCYERMKKLMQKIIFNLYLLFFSTSKQSVTKIGTIIFCSKGKNLEIISVKFHEFEYFCYWHKIWQDANEKASILNDKNCHIKSVPSGLLENGNL